MLPLTNMTHRILVSDGLAEDGLALLRTAGEVTANPKITPEELLAVLPEYHALVVRSRTRVTAKVLEAGTSLKVVGRAGVGVDNIDVAAAVARGVIVVNSPLAASISVAEHTLGLMLALARAIPAADASMKQGKWEKSAFMGGELAGKTLGLLGIGRIGAELAQRAAAFGMSVLAYDPYLTPDQIRARGADAASFDDALARADYLSLHLPLTAETRGLLGPAQFAAMKKGARLICAARGGVIDEDALRAALDSSQLAGAALDVFAIEPPPAGSIAAHPRVVATPHVGAQTHEAQSRAGVMIAEEVLAVLQGRGPRWRVTSNE
ncbi:MAG: hydroxyacid dehydrogenase [Chloroflexi bacterium]|nr:hydroxyacid dehydrogenase [Chloroflexota bacterium]